MIEPLAQLNPNFIDKNKFSGDGLLCFLDLYTNGLSVNHTVSERYRWTISHLNPYAKKCRENCMNPNTVCPSDCLCRWYKLPVKQ